MTCDIDQYRANALRVLARIIDPAMLPAIERYVKQSIVDSYSPLSSSGLLAGLRLSQRSPDAGTIVRKWVSETHQAILRHKGMVQFHALMLLYEMKKSDRLAVSKIVTQYRQEGILKSPMAKIMIIRYSTKLMLDEAAPNRGVSLQLISSFCREGVAFLKECLAESSELVAFEAARAMSLLPLPSEDMMVAVELMNLFLLSSKPCVRLGALKTLASISEVFPGIVSRCNQELTKLMKTKNSLISALVVTILLKTSSEDMVPTLLEEVSKTIQTMEVEDRIDIVKSVLTLSLRYPSKHSMLMGFLEQQLRLQNDYKLKHAIVRGITESVDAYPETADISLRILSRALDYCEYVHLTTDILLIMAGRSKMLTNAADHIPYIYNCFMLGKAPVRAAAVSSMSKIASQHPSLRKSLLILLKMCRRDECDEIRDRATVEVAILECAISEKPEYLMPDADEEPSDTPADGDVAAHIHSLLPLSFRTLTRSLEALKVDEEAMNDATVVTLETLPSVQEYPAGPDVVPSTGENLSMIRQKPVKAADAVYAVPELAALGTIIKSSAPVPLTERETEYVVQCVKHVYVEHLVLQFKVQNTVEYQRLSDVSVAVMERDEEGLYQPVGELSVPSISYGASESCFVVLKRDTEKRLSPCVFACELQFRVSSVDNETGEDMGDCVEEEYSMEDLEVVPSDYITGIAISDFRLSWEKLGKENEEFKKVGLQFDSLHAAVKSVVSFLGMNVCDNTDRVKPQGSSQVLHLCGCINGQERVLARAQLSPHNGFFVMKIIARSENPEARHTIMDWIH
jgi:coatomer protein complex subunit gamma